MSNMPGVRSFRGGYLLSLDSKNRINIPAPFQRIIKEMEQTSIMLAFNISRNGFKFIELWPTSSWNDHIRKIKNEWRSQMSAEEFQHIMEFYALTAMEQSLDKQGRVVIPSNIRSMLGIRYVQQEDTEDESKEKNSLYLIGSGKYMKLYRFEDFTADMEADRRRVNVHDIFMKIGAYIPEDY